MDVGRIHLEDVEQARPVLAQPFKGRIRLRGVQVLGDDRLDRLFVDDLGVRRIELLVGRIFVVAEHEDDLPRLSGGQVELHLMGADGRPAVGNGVGELAGFHGGGRIPAAIAAQEGLALRVEASSGLRAGEVGKVIAALAILSLVIDDAVLDLDLADVEIALEVGGVVLGVP